MFLEKIEGEEPREMADHSRRGRGHRAVIEDQRAVRYFSAEELEAAGAFDLE